MKQNLSSKLKENALCDHKPFSPRVAVSVKKFSSQPKFSLGRIQILPIYQGIPPNFETLVADHLWYRPFATQYRAKNDSGHL
jgi:hypothetical protein